MAFLINNTEHTVGNHRCEECFRGYPAKCSCGGFIHAQFIKETWQGEMQLSFLCDLCGENLKFPGQTAAKRPHRFGRRKFNKRR